MIAALATLLSFQLAGEALVYALQLPLPGPVVGIALLVAAFFIRPTLVDMLRPTSMTLLQHLSLLFVPAGVGVMVHGERLSHEGFAIIVAIVGSTLLAIAATALTVNALLRRTPDEKSK